MKSSNTNFHILIVCSSLNVAGGLERMVVELANKLAESGYKVSLLIVDFETNSFYPLHPKISSYFINLKFGIGNIGKYLQRKVDFIRSIFLFRRKVYQIDPNIIISTDYQFCVASLVARFGKSVKVISWQHSSFFNEKSNFWRWFYTAALRSVNCIVCLNKDEQLIYKRFNQQVNVIPNFIDIPIVKSDVNSKTILTIARLDKKKGIDLLMDAAKIILNKYSDWQWKVIGGGSSKEHLCEFIKKNKQEQKLLLQQASNSNLKEEYHNASIYVSTSRFETFSMVLIEAMSHGVPCISFDCDTGPRHIIHNNVDGLLVEKDQSIKLAEAIESLITNEKKRKQMGEAAYINVQRFSSEIIIKKWEALFQRLLSPPTKS